MPSSDYTDYVRFLRSWASAPARVSAIAPSSEALARLITSEISPADGPVLELGPGTGVFTRALLARGLKEEDLTLIECGPEFAQMLRDRFPQVRLLTIDAARLARADFFEQGKVGAVVSGLPLLSFSPRKVMMILAGTFRQMQPDATFYQFTYGPWCPVPRPILERLGLKATLMGRTVRNIPPAGVYRIMRKAVPAQAEIEEHPLAATDPHH